MIANSTITHDFSPLPLSTFQFTSPVLHSFLLAALTTILSYQSAAAVLDLVIGFKPKGKASLPSLALLHFSQSSFFSAITALFNNRTLSQLCYHGVHTTPASCSSFPAELPQPHSLSRFVVVKFLILLAAAPFLNLVSILLSLEIDDTLTFADASFGGLALGIVNEPQWDLMPNVNCWKLDTQFEANEEALAEFYICLDLILEFHPVNNLSLTVRVSANQVGSVRVDIFNGNYIISAIVYGNLRTQGRLYRFKNSIKDETLLKLVETGASILIKTCGENVDSQIPGATVSRRDGIVMAETLVYCESAEPRQMADLLRKIAGRIALVNDDGFDVLPYEDIEGSGKYVPAENLILMRRRRPPVSFIALVIVVLIVCTIRQIVKWITDNDIVLGIEMILKKGLGLDFFDFMLQRKELVHYAAGDMKVDGKELHHGLGMVCGTNSEFEKGQYEPAFEFRWNEEECRSSTLELSESCSNLGSSV